MRQLFYHLSKIYIFFFLSDATRLFVIARNRANDRKDWSQKRFSHFEKHNLHGDKN